MYISIINDFSISSWLPYFSPVERMQIIRERKKKKKRIGDAMSLKENLPLLKFIGALQRLVTLKS